MDKVEVIKQAFIMAYNGYTEATFEVERVRTKKGMHRLHNMQGPDFALSSLAPVAAEIYRQLTSVVVVQIGSSERRAGAEDLKEAAELLKKTNIKADVVASQDTRFRVLDNEYVVRIIIETPEGEVTEEEKEIRKYFDAEYKMENPIGKEDSYGGDEE